MTPQVQSATYEPDPAAVFASALSLWKAGHKRAEEEKVSLGDLFSGMDGFMRAIMAIANRFETWACAHIDFQRLEVTWPYLLEEGFGEECLEAMYLSDLTGFNDNDCLRIAMRLRLPIEIDDKLPVPVDVTAANLNAASGFKKFRIQTVRNHCEEQDVYPYTIADEPFDDEYSAPYFGLYGVDAEGLLEHIADRATYAEALKLARNLSLGIDFPDSP